MSRVYLRPYTKSLVLNGASLYATKANPSGINTGTNSRSMSGWVWLKADDLGCFVQFKTNSVQSPAGTLGQLSGTYYFALDTVNGGNNLTITKAQFQANFPLMRWIHVAWVFTTTSASLYANGSLVKTQSWGVALNTGTYDNLHVGKATTAAQAEIYFLNGYLKDVRIHNGAISATEITNEYYYNQASSTLVDKYLMEEGSGTTIADSIGSNSLTTNAAWSSTNVPTAARSASARRVALRSTPYSIVGVASATSGLTIPNNAALNPTAAVTLMLWFRFSAKNSSTSSMFDNSQAGVTNSYFFDYLNDATGFRWYSTIGGIARNITTTTKRLDLNTWHFVTATYTGSAVYLYLDGVKLAEEITGISGALGTNVNQLCLLRSAAGAANAAMMGTFYRPMIFNVGCTLAEHQDVFYNNKFSAALSAGKVLDLAMTEGSGSTIADTSPTGATATIGGASSWSSALVPFKTRSAASTRSVA